LRVGGGEKDIEPEHASLDLVPAGPVVWRLSGHLGRRYAAVSGDHNPIHLYRLTAKAFGFPRQIAHGMWTKARCVAALDNRLPDAVTVRVEFKKPVFLPGTVALGSRIDDDGVAFSLTRPKDGAPHLVGRATPA
ncbi:MAG TPA: MaoC/PaaZ C-terminal domain-containing protein, partial [Marmoricola sp.]|nr:MaoC/PaaZ C-terminal domain-containing protein [Marmoricola sp.]